MSFNVGFYGNSGRIHGHPRSILNASPNSSCYDDINHEQHKWDNKQALMFEYERNQDLVFKLTDEVKKTVNESMESVISGLRNEVTELRSELASIKKEETSRCCVSKQGRFLKVLLVSLVLTLNVIHKVFLFIDLGIKKLKTNLMGVNCEYHNNRYC